MEYPVGISYLAWLSAKVTQIHPTGPPVSARHHVDPGAMWSLPGMRKEVNTYFLVTALFLGAFGLLATFFLSGVNPRRPWDALPFVLSPTLFMTDLINWDMLAVVLVAGALWAWARDRPGLTGVMIGLGTAAKLYPVFLLGPILIIAWRRRRLGGAACGGGIGGCDVGVGERARVPGRPRPVAGLLAVQLRPRRRPRVGVARPTHHGHLFTADTINKWSWLLFGAVCVLVALLGLLAPRTPRLAQLAFLVVAGFLLVNKVYSPQYVLWLLPLAVLARPRWRDLLIWQAGELLYLSPSGPTSAAGSRRRSAVAPRSTTSRSGCGWRRSSTWSRWWCATSSAPSTIPWATTDDPVVQNESRSWASRTRRLDDR